MMYFNSGSGDIEIFWLQQYNNYTLITMLNMYQRKLYSPCVATRQLPGEDKDPTKYD